MGTPLQRTSQLHQPLARHPLAAVAVVAVACGVAASTGCRSGASAMSAPSWWSFGGGKASDAEKLTAAPPFEGSLKKPSESATPYPTTTTPNGYALADATAGAAQQPVSPPALAAAEPAAITYGSQPAAPAMAAATPSTAVTAPPAQPAGPSIAPQVGPYASLADSPPSATPAPAMVAAPASGAFPATAGYEPAAPARTPDPYGLAAPSAANPAGPAAVDPVSPASRYAAVPGSRFGGASFGGPPSAPPLEPAASALPSAAALPASAPPLSVSPPPAASPLSAAPSPAVAPPLPSTPALPGAPPPPATPATAPPRRPDPGYRPAGTSSYRPTRAILVDSAPAAPSAVRTASFETPAPAVP